MSDNLDASEDVGIDKPQTVGELVEEIVDDPDTDVLYLLTQASRGDTVGQTLTDEPLTYQENVGLTSAALLDGIARAGKIDDDVDISSFVEDVIEEAKSRGLATTEGDSEI